MNSIERFRWRADKWPDSLPRIIDNISAAIASSFLARDFGQDCDAFLADNPKVAEHIAELKSLREDLAERLTTK